MFNVLLSAFSAKKDTKPYMKPNSTCFYSNIEIRKLVNAFY